MRRALAPLKSAVKAVVATGPGFALSRRSRKPGCVVFVYHRVGLPTDPFPNLDVDTFRGQIDWLTRHCNVIAPEDMRASAESDRSSGRPDVLITFDDGYRDYYEHAYPVLREYRVRALNFLSTRFVDDPTLIGWWDRLYLAARATTRARAVLPWAPEVYDLDARGKARLLRAAKDYIKRQPERDKDAITGTILEALGVDASHLDAPRQTMTWDEVRRSSDFTCYGGHTHSHVIVSRLDRESLRAEIRSCRDRMAAELGTAPDMFAYPNGRAIDFTEEAKEILREFGFRTAFSTIDGVNGADTDWMEVRRIACGASVTDVAWRLSRL